MSVKTNESKTKKHTGRFLPVLLLLLSLAASVFFGSTYAKYQYSSSKKAVTLNVSASYAIHYFDQGGGDFSGTHEEGYPEAHTYGTDTTLKGATKDGYAFDGWFTDAECARTPVTTLGGTAYRDDIDLYALWRLDSFTVSLDGDDGIASTNGAGSYSFGADVSISATPKGGYGFTGWYNGETLVSTDNPYEFTMPDSNLAYQAKSELLSYTITYNPNGGSDVASQDYDINTSVTLADASVKTGYTFDAWNLSSPVGNWAAGDYQKKAAIGTGKFGSIRLDAKWTPITYTVSYQGGNATGGSMEPLIHIYDIEKELAPNAFERKYTVTYNHNYSGSTDTSDTAAYSFKQWTDGTQTYTDGQTVKNLASTQDANVILTAMWDTGSVTLETPTRTGYTFGGWYKEAACTNKIGDAGDSYTPTANQTIYAKWTPITYTVSYAGGGSTGGSTATSTHTYDVDKALTANGFERKYTVTYDHNYSGSTDTDDTAVYTFKRWKDGSGNTYTNKQTVKNLASTQDANVALTAVWDTGSVTLETPTRTGYIFGGWYKEAACTNRIGEAGDSYAPTANQTVYAKWTPITYTVQYDKGLGTGGSTASSSHTYDVAKNLTANGFERKYTVTYNHNGSGQADTSAQSVYTFENWTGSDGNTYGNSQSVVNLTSTQGDLLTMTANWKDGEITLESPTRSGYRFAGWYSDQACKNKVGDGGGSYTPTADITLYAKWVANYDLVPGGEIRETGSFSAKVIEASGITPAEDARGKIAPFTELTFDYLTDEHDAAYWTNLGYAKTNVPADKSGAGTIEIWISNDKSKVLILSEGDIYTDADCSEFLYNWQNLSKVTFNNFHTPNTTNMESFFQYDFALQNVDVSGFDTSNVTDMIAMFYQTKLNTLDISMWDTSKVTDMTYMFDGNFSLTSINVSGIDTSSVTSMQNLFNSCTALQSVDVSGFNTSNVTTMANMFNDCAALSSVNVSNFDTSKVTDMSSMFQYCRSLTSIDVSGFNTGNVTTVANMFNICSALTSVNMSGLNLSKVNNANFANLLNACSNLKTVNMAGINLSGLTSLSNIYNGKGLTALTSVDMSNANTTNVTTAANMFSGCSALESVNLNGINLSKITSNNNVSGFFANCSRLKTINMAGINLSGLSSLNNLFNIDGLTALTTLNMRNADISKVTSMESLFKNCSALQKVDMDGAKAYSVTNMDDTFQYLSNLTEVIMPTITSSCSFSATFGQCSNLKTVDLCGVTASTNKTSLYHMFNGDSKLTTVYASGHWTNYDGLGTQMFGSCNSIVGNAYNGKKAYEYQGTFGQGPGKAYVNGLGGEQGYFSHHDHASPSNIVMSVVYVNNEVEGSLE